ncbi:hypothetical protein L5515_013062 [Caenorhabditis briggsae]|uniref:G-patch domain-containing protein n=1 Tax=Caenorhabditis briggsae TaxID=6238 RepID=A0AAE9J5K4_CAEBR|nr:hypothetical protein L5515_013062 [Caenorhabditis briggsae]
MSILAEPKRKQKISVDPQNLTWKNDDKKFSKKLMEKMGWSEGDGLGRNRQGNQDAVKLRANTSGRGLGADKMADYDSTWISHHDDFADLLAALNKNKEEKTEDQTEEEREKAAEKISIELKSKSIRRRIHYQKFTRAKDTTNYSDSHKKGILGYGRLKSDATSTTTEDVVENAAPEVQTEKSTDSENEKKEGNNTVSTLSVGDYFAAKMAALKAKREAAAKEIKTEIIEEIEIKTEIKEEISEESDEEKAKRKAEKKERKRLRREQRQREEEEEAENMVEIKQEIKEEPIDEEIDEAERKRLKKEKKRLKRLHEELEQQQNGAASGEPEDVEDEIPKKRKKHTEEEH